jgi:hypothetical protein
LKLLFWKHVMRRQNGQSRNPIIERHRSLFIVGIRSIVSVPRLF